MVPRYRYGHRPGRRRRTRVLIVLAVSLLIVAGVGGLLGYDLYKNRNEPVTGTGRTIAQALDESVNKLSIDEPTFTMELPSDWKEIDRKNDAHNRSIKWQASKKNAENRYLELFIDIIPTTRSINRLMPVSVLGNGLTTGDISVNCASFTKGGSFNIAEAAKLSDTPAKYQSVDFICDLPRVTDNEVGTGSIGGVNSVSVKGAKGEHKYFFLYTDRNIQPDDTIFYNAVKSFKAK